VLRFKCCRHPVLSGLENRVEAAFQVLYFSCSLKEKDGMKRAAVNLVLVGSQSQHIFFETSPESETMHPTNTHEDGLFEGTRLSTRFSVKLALQHKTKIIIEVLHNDAT
jgi:hypothetical protein